MSKTVKIIYMHSVFLMQANQLNHSKEHFFSEKLTVQLAKKFPTFYATPKVLIILTSNHHFSLPYANTFLRHIVILSYHLCLGLPSGLFPSPTKTM